MQGNKERSSARVLLGRARDGLQRWRQRNGQTVYNQVLRGAAYTLGSGAVSLIVLWVQSRF